MFNLKLFFILISFFYTGSISAGLDEPSCEDLGYDDCSTRVNPLFELIVYGFLLLLLIFTRGAKYYFLMCAFMLASIYFVVKVSSLVDDSYRKVCEIFLGLFIFYVVKSRGDRLIDLIDGFLDVIHGKEGRISDSKKDFDNGSNINVNQNINTNGYIKKEVEVNRSEKSFDLSLDVSDKINFYVQKNNDVNSKKKYVENKVDSISIQDIEAPEKTSNSITVKQEDIEINKVDKVLNNIVLADYWFCILPNDPVVVNAHKMVIRKKIKKLIEGEKIPFSDLNQISDQSRILKLLIISHAIFDLKYDLPMVKMELFELNTSDYLQANNIPNSDVSGFIKGFRSKFKLTNYELSDIELDIQNW